MPKKKKSFFMNIIDVGKVRVTKRPKRIPKTVTIGGRKHKVIRSVFNAVWAVNHMTAKERKRIGKKLGLPTRMR